MEAAECTQERAVSTTFRQAQKKEEETINRRTRNKKEKNKTDKKTPKAYLLLALDGKEQESLCASVFPN